MSFWSANLKLPYMAAAQAQKHVTHNEALELLDAIVQLTVKAFDATTPPLLANEGDVWAIGSGAVNEWAGHDGELSVSSNGTWLFIEPRTGWRAANESDLRIYDGGAWIKPALPELQNLPGVGVGTSYDAGNPLSVSGAATLLSHEGSGHQLKINKAATVDTASMLFQTGWSGRAEFGTVGSDDFAMKVSPDGTAWFTALTLAGTSGRVRFGQPGELPDGSAAAPSLTFANDADSGFFRVGNDAVGAAVGGAKQWHWSPTTFQLDVPMTGAAVQVSTTDVTAGRLMKTGAFGLGATGATPAATDLNTIAAPGFYRIAQANAATGNAPTTAQGWMVLHHQFDAADATQTAWAAGVATIEVWRRVKQGSVWQPWSRHSVQTGSNSNGSFVRFADGTQICRHFQSSSLASETATGSLFTSAAEVTWVFPATFADVGVFVHCNPRTSTSVWGRGRPTAATQGALRLFSATSVTVPLTCDFIAIGRWS